MLSPVVRKPTLSGCHGHGAGTARLRTYADRMDSEDAKLVTLARASRARSGSSEGAAVRDLDGRSYAAATVSLPSLQLSALRLATAMAVSSGARGLEAAAVVSDGEGPGRDDLAAVRDLAGAGVPVLCADASGALRARHST